MRIFMAAVFTPIASAIRAPPLRARIARPERESSRLRSRMTKPSTASQIMKYMLLPEPRSRPNSVIGGMPAMPSYLPRNSMFPNR